MSTSTKAAKAGLDIRFLGSGNAFAAEGRAYNAFLVNKKVLFDAGPTLMPQMGKARLNPGEIDAIFISHFHADHFFGLPFLMLDFWMNDRQEDLYIVGPPGIEERTEQLMEIAFPGLPSRPGLYRRRYIEAHDGEGGEVPGVEFRAAEVEHVPSLKCFGYSTKINNKTLAYSGDTTLCSGLLSLAANADVLVLDCNCGGDPVHLGQEDIAHVIDKAPAHATTIVSHLDAMPAVGETPGVFVASDLKRFRL